MSDYQDIPDTPEQRALIAEYNAKLSGKLVPIEEPAIDAVTAEITRLQARIAELEADARFFEENRNNWQDAATQRHHRITRLQAAPDAKDALIRELVSTLRTTYDEHGDDDDECNCNSCTQQRSALAHAKGAGYE